MRLNSGLSLVVKGLSTSCDKVLTRQNQSLLYNFATSNTEGKYKGSLCMQRKKGEMKGENKDVGVLRSCTLLTKHAEFKTVQGGQIGFQKEG